MKDEQVRCSCSGDASYTLLFACSGGADVGEISDRAVRELARRGAGSVFCLAGIGGNVSGIVASTKAADRIVVLDGCPLDCAAKTLERAGIEDFVRTRVTDTDLSKGSADVTERTITEVADSLEKLLR